MSEGQPRAIRPKRFIYLGNENLGHQPGVCETLSSHEPFENNFFP